MSLASPPDVAPAIELPDERGAVLRSDGAVRFSVWAPQAHELSVRVYTGPAAGDHSLARAHASGLFEATIADVGAGADYRFLLHGERELPDPASRWQPEGVHGPSRVDDPAAFPWSDGGWSGLALPDLVVYELHVGTFTQAGTFDAAAAELPALRDLGITAIELMPVGEFSGGRNWGYDGVYIFAPQSTYGGPEGLRRFVDSAHRLGMAVLLDVVYNHAGPEGNYLDNFGPYFTDRYRTPWGLAFNYDGPDSDEVRRRVIENARHWVRDYHIDGLRLDAVQGIVDLGASPVVREIAEEARAAGRAAGRTVVVFAETDRNDPRTVSPREVGGLACDAQWADDFHHALHAALTGERFGYYQDFGGIAPLAAALREPFVHAGGYSTFRRRRHGVPSTGLPRERFLVCAQNHDQVGNRAGGERLSVLVEPARLRLAAALLLLSPYIPLLFMGEEYGETNPFHYFVSFEDPSLVEAVRRGRREEFAAFAWPGAFPDPQAEETFRCARLDRAKLAAPAHRALYELHRDLLTVRREESALRPGAAPHEVAHHEDVDGGWIALRRGEGRDALLALFNCAPVARSLPLPSMAAGRWRLRLSTDAAGYGGEGAAAEWIGEDDGASDIEGPRRLIAREAQVPLPPWSAALYQRVVRGA